MDPISFKRHRFPAAVIVQAVRWYFRFTLSIRDVEELMAERGVEVSREAIRCWVIKFGPLIAANLRRNRPSPTGAVRQTLTCLHLERPKPLMGMIFREADFVQASPISG
jgi:transposase-like protein